MARLTETFYNPNLPHKVKETPGTRKGSPVGKKVRTDKVKNFNNRKFEAPTTQSKHRKVLTTESYVAGHAAPRRVKS
jgi:hypothetical protein